VASKSDINVLDRLNQTIELLEHTSPEVAIWDEVQAYASRLNELIKKKLSEREVVLRRQEISVNLDNLKQALASELDYHEIPMWREWSVNNLMIDSDQTAQNHNELLTDFREYLEKYKQLKETRPSNISEENKLNHEKIDCSQEISQLSARLEPLFLTGQMENQQEQDSKSAEEKPEIEEIETNVTPAEDKIKLKEDGQKPKDSEDRNDTTPIITKNEEKEETGAKVKRTKKNALSESDFENLNHIAEISILIDEYERENAADQEEIYIDPYRGFLQSSELEKVQKFIEENKKANNRPDDKYEEKPTTRENAADAVNEKGINNEKAAKETEEPAAEDALQTSGKSDLKEDTESKESGFTRDQVAETNENVNLVDLSGSESDDKDRQKETLEPFSDQGSRPNESGPNESGHDNTEHPDPSPINPPKEEHSKSEPINEISDDTLLEAHLSLRQTCGSLCSERDTLAQAWLAVKYAGEVGIGHLIHLPTLMQIEIVHWHYWMYKNRYYDKEKPLMRVEEIVASMTDSDLTYTQRCLQVASLVPLLLLDGVESCYGPLKGCRTDDLPSTIGEIKDTAINYWEEVWRPIQQGQGHHEMKRIAQNLIDAFDKARKSKFTYYLANRIKDKLFPQEGIGEFSWLLNELEKGTPSKKMREWCRNYNPEKDLQRLEKSISVTDKTEGVQKRKLLGHMNTIWQASRDWIHTFDNEEQNIDSKHEWSMNKLSSAVRENCNRWQESLQEWDKDLAIASSWTNWCLLDIAAALGVQDDE